MPTDRPRYQVTDTGPVRAMLDTAAQRWPDVRDRKALLLRLAEMGSQQLTDERAARDTRTARERQVAAAAQSLELLDADVLLGDHAWS